MTVHHSLFWRKSRTTMVKPAIFTGRKKLAQRLLYYRYGLMGLHCRSGSSFSCVVRGHREVEMAFLMSAGGNAGEDNGVLRSNPRAPFFFDPEPVA